MSLGIASLPTVSRRSSFRDDTDIEAQRQSHVHPEIEIIKATPKESPNISSERQSFKETQQGVELRNLRRLPTLSSNVDDNGFDDIAEYPDEIVIEEPKRHKKEPEQPPPPPQPPDESRRAPLASLSSFKLSSADCNDSIELHSLGSDTVFDDYYADTEDDMEPLSTDSDQFSCSNVVEPSPRKSILKNANNNTDNSNNKCTCDSITISQAGSSGTGSGNEIIIISDSRGNRISIIPRFKTDPSCSSLGQTKTFETQAIIERHDSDTIKATTSSTITATIPCTETGGGSDTNLQKHRTKFFNLIDVKRPASTMTSYSSSSKPNLFRNISRSNSLTKKTKKQISSNNNNNDSSEEDDDNIETQRQISARCVDASVVVRDLSPCVVLELPLLAAQGDAKEKEEERQEQEFANPTTLDPDTGGTARKWSRETLF